MRLNNHALFHSFIQLFLSNINQLCGPQVIFEHSETLTCTDSDSADKLLSPATAAHHQRQVSLLY